MFGKKIKEKQPEVEKKEKPVPAFLRPDYPYKAVGDVLKPEDCEKGIVYEIKCHVCEMSIRTKGQNIRSTYERLLAGNGCIECGNKELVIRAVDMSKTSVNNKNSNGRGVL